MAPGESGCIEIERREPEANIDVRMRISDTGKRVVLGVLVAMACLSLAQGMRNAVTRQAGSQDFQWSTSRALLEHDNPYAEANAPGGKSPRMLSQSACYPASGLVLLWPYALCQWPTAKLFWALSNLFFTAVILCCLFRLLPVETSRPTKLLITALFIMSTPWRMAVGNGQHALFALSFFLLATAMFEQRRNAASVPLSVAWFKWTITFPLSIFFARSRRGWAALLVAVAIQVVLTVFAAVWIGGSPVELLLGPLRIGRGFMGAGHLDLMAIASNLGLSSKWLPIAASLIVLGVAWLAARRDADTLSCLSMLSLTSMVVGYHLAYDFVVLVIPLCYAFREGVSTSRGKAYMLLVGLIWFVDKIVFVAVKQSAFSGLAGIQSFYYWVEVVVFYAVLCADLLGIFGHRENRVGSPAPA